MEAPRKKAAKGEKLTASSSSSSSAIGDLPGYILMEILCRLPIETLVASKCVCKSWLRLVTDPQFSQLHQATAPMEVCFYGQKATRLYMGNLHHFLNNPPHYPDMNVHTLFQLTKFKVYCSNGLNYNTTTMMLHYANSCNGLLCFRSYANKFAVIWNPITSEFATFPAPTKPGGCSMWCSYGLGFSRKANRFKLLRLVERKDKRTSEEVFVYEICAIEKGCSWKAVGPFPYTDCPRHSLTWDQCTFFQGSLNWIGVNSSSSVDIGVFSFDFEDDQFGKVPLPPDYGQSQSQKRRNTRFAVKLGVMAGCLSINENTDEGVSIWLMKEYGVQDSWTKVLSLEFRCEKFSSQSCVPITELGNGEILLTNSGIHGRDYTDLFFCNPVHKGIRVIGACHNFLEVIAFRPTLVLLKDSMMGYDVHVKPRCPVFSHSRITTTHSWWEFLEKEEKRFYYRRPHESAAPLTNDDFCVTVTGRENNGPVYSVSEFSVHKSSAALLEHRPGTCALPTGAGGESHGRTSGTGLVQTPASVNSEPETSTVELSLQEVSMTPMTNDAREESHGPNNGMGSVQNMTSVFSGLGTVTSELALEQGSDTPLAKDEIFAHVRREEREGCAKTHVPIEDPLERTETTVEKVLEELRKERQQRKELEERLKNELAKYEPLKEQIQHTEQLKQQNQKLEERLRNEQAKVEQLKEQIRQSEQLKQQKEQMMLQVVDELRVHLTGSC